MATPVDRTLYFDFLPLRLPPIRGLNVRLQLFTVPGQVYFNATRKLALTGADGIVFVSDSQLVRADANLESLENLRGDLKGQGRDLAHIPLVFQHNKRDLPDLLPLEELDQMLNTFGAPSVPTCAKTGDGVYEALDRICERVLSTFADRLPESPEAGLPSSFEPIEGGLVTALRDASQRDDARGDAVVAHIAAPDTQASFPEGLESAPLPLVNAHDRAQSPATRKGRPTAPPLGTMPPGASESGVSFAELWPEAERAMVREVEEAIRWGRYFRAIELCDALVSRVLASAAGLFGSTEAPRDAAVVPILLGLDGRRYLSFRSLVREARGDGVITARDALTAYAFTIDARIARSSIS